MLDEEILELRRKLDESLAKDKKYDNTYKLSVELDELITKYYKRKLVDYGAMKELQGYNSRGKYNSKIKIKDYIEKRNLTA